MKFTLSAFVATPAALETLAEAGDGPWPYLHRHLCGDWGELDSEDRAVNDRAVLSGDRLLSAYRLSTGGRI